MAYNLLKKLCMRFFLFIFIFVNFIGCHVFEKKKKDKITMSFFQRVESQSDSGANKQKKLNAKEAKNNLSKKLKRGYLKPKCGFSSRSQKKINSYIVSIRDNFLKDESIEELLNLHLDDIKKNWPSKCPSHCSVLNDYSVLAKVYPVKVKKGSCNKQEAEETYKLGKSFYMEGAGKKDKKKVYKEAGNWLFSVFIKPFIPFSKNLPIEVERHQIKKACPSCSFYLDYTYRYTKDNQLSLNVVASCGDRRTLLSKFQSDFFLVNNWKCIENKSL